MADSPSSSPSDLGAAASTWLARRDRGLTAAEQDAYLEWLRADATHSAAIAQLEKTWNALDVLAEWKPAHSAQPNPDLLAQPASVPVVRRTRWMMATLAAAAAVVVGFTVWQMTHREAVPTVRVIPSPERLILVDGSVVELNHDGKITTEFTAETRRVRLLRGEAHFTVAKNPLRPFIVEAEGVAVRAVGTAFDVRHAAGAVEVLVTEGKVQVERPAPSTQPRATVSAAPTPLVAGERAVVDTRVPDATPVVAPVTPAEIARALSWQGVRLEFEAMPLADAVTEFNLRNRQQLVIADAAAGRVRIGGNFRADNVDAFVRLLESSFNVVAERRADGVLALRTEK